MLALENLTVRYGRIAAVRGISLTVSEGETIAVIGPNGAGKSTTLAAIAGDVPVAGGSILFEGRSLAGRSPEQIVRLGIGLVPEGRRIFGTLSVAENLRMGMTVRSDRAAAEADLERLLKRLPALSVYYHSSAARLSGGEQQQLAIARALLGKPRLLMLDEPSLGLAPLVLDLVFDVLAELRETGTTMLLVEQNARRAIEFADRTYVLRGGRIVEAGTREEFAARKLDLSRVYLGLKAR